MNSTRNHRATGLGTDRQAARMKWRVVSADGRLLAGNETEAGAKATAAKLNQGGRAEPVRVVKRGEKS